jgi:regulator of protease activity HflC (stomatin/prohibitin superfamily)
MTCFWLFIVTCFLLLGAVLASRLATSGSDERARYGVGTAVLAVLALAFLVVSVLAPVGTKNVAVLTTFGKPTGHLGNGFHVKAPWQVKNELSDAIQTDTYASDKGQGVQSNADGSCINVRIARQATACVNVSIRWQIKESGVDYLFRNYKDNTAITQNLLLRDLQTAVNGAFAGYDPLGLDPNGNSNQPTAAALAAKVQATMRSDIGTYIDVNSLLIPIFNFDPGTQDKLNQLQQQYAATRVAKQQLLTNQAQAAANKALAASVSNSPGILQSKCLDIVKDAVDNNRPLPAGFSCFGTGIGLAVTPK